MCLFSAAIELRFSFVPSFCCLEMKRVLSKASSTYNSDAADIQPPLDDVVPAVVGGDDAIVHIIVGVSLSWVLKLASSL